MTRRRGKVAQLELGAEKLTEDLAEADQEAKDAEFFETPPAAIESLLTLPGGLALPGGVWVDPCAGRGAIPKAASRQRPDVIWALAELRAICRPDLDALTDRHQVCAMRPVIGDFLAEAGDALRELGDQVAVVIMNSPFSLTLRFVGRAWELFPKAWVVSLQRQSWVGPARLAWLTEHMPQRLSLPFRPSFRLDGKTDGCEYEWHAWQPDGRNLGSAPARMLPMPSGQLGLFG